MTVRRKPKPNRTRASTEALAGAFHDASAPPIGRDLSTALGAAGSLWRQFMREVRPAGNVAIRESQSRTR